jgi:anti-sigma B factor antagonist
MKFSVREQDGVTILAPKGKIMGGPDSTELQEKLRDLIKGNTKRVIIDLAEVDWMNSTGLGIMIAGLTTMRTAGGELKLARVTDKIQSLLVITKLVTVFESHDSVEQAIGSFGKK